MEMYLSSMQWVFERLEQWLRVASKREKEAIDLFLDALHETQKYLAKIERNKDAANEDSENRISDAWHKAAKAVRTHDEDLYRRCLAKACHWSGSERFKNTEISEINTSIEKMLEIAASKGHA